jgi:hypothetical protein
LEDLNELTGQITVGGLDLLMEDAVMAEVMNLHICLLHESIKRFAL